MPGLATKMRPKSFDEYMGDDIRNTLTTRMSKVESYPHTVLLYGERGCGKTTAARLLAKEYECQMKREDPEHYKKACGECDACKLIDELLIDGDAASDTASTGVIELDIATDSNKAAIDKALEEAMEPPMYPMAYRIVILDECHMATKQAQNRLLKIAEEPPEHLILILCTTDPDMLLPTLIDRCAMKIRVRKADLDTMSNKMLDACKQFGWKTSMKALRTIVRKCERNPRRCWSTLEQIAEDNNGDASLDSVSRFYGGTDDTVYQKYIEAARGSISDIVNFVADNLTDKGVEYRDFINGFTGYVISCVEIKSGVGLENYADEFKAEVKKLFSNYDTTEFDVLLQIVEYMNEQTSRSDNESEKLKLIIINTALRIGKLQILSVGLHNEKIEALKENKAGLNAAIDMKDKASKVNDVTTFGIQDDVLQTVFGKKVAEIKPGEKQPDEVDGLIDDSDDGDEWSDEALMNLGLDK